MSSFCAAIRCAGNSSTASCLYSIAWPGDHANSPLSHTSVVCDFPQYFASLRPQGRPDALQLTTGGNLDINAP